MGRRLVPVTMVSAMLAFAVAAGAIGMVPWKPINWSPSVRLVVAAGIVPMIFAVSIRVMPVFSRRNWRSERLLLAQVAVTIAGGWLLFAGGLERDASLTRTGHLLLGAGGLLFMTNLVLLFRQPPLPNRPAPPQPYPEHPQVDQVARRFTMFSGLFLLFGLGAGVATNLWRPDSGRWDLVWAHALLVGFFLSMASGICYHVLARWTGHRWRSIRAIRLHLLTTVICLPLMLLALATDRNGLFSVAGPIQGTALLLFLFNIVPMIWRMPQPSRWPLVLAVTALVTGVLLGAMFAGHPVVGVHYRMVHAEINLFGWTGLLIAGMAYYLVPRMFGYPLRWPRLAYLQTWLLTAGVSASALALTWRIERGGAEVAIAIAHAMIASSFVLLGVLIGVTMGSARSTRVVSPITLNRTFTRPPSPAGN